MKKGAGAEGPGSLQEDRLSPAYKGRLLQAGRLFLAWLARSGVAREQLWTDAALMNEVLISYVQGLFNGSSPLSLAVHTVLWVQTVHRPFKGRLRAAWDSVQSWRVKAPVVSRTPMPETVLRGFIAYGVMAALALEPSKAELWWRFLVLLQVGFHGLLRPKELLGLRRRHLKLPGGEDPLMPQLAVVCVEEPKNRAYMGRLQSRLVRSPVAVAWLSWMSAGMTDDEPLWPHTAWRFRCCLAQASEFFGLSRMRLTAGSLRAGGATHLLEQGSPVSSIRFAGGWASEKSLASYLQEAESASVLLQVTAAEARRLKWALSTFACLSRPPRRPFSALA